MFDGFQSAQIEAGETTIFTRRHGSGPPLLLLHGFPQTHLMWHAVAPLLARDFTVVCADLRGYGQSGCPPSAPDHAPYSKRTMARDMVAVMERLGFPRFSVAGHDRGGRVAYRLALDHPDRVERIAVLDIVPTAAAWDRANAQFALGYWPWTVLAQAEPLPERILTATADTIVEEALRGWGSPPDAFPGQVRSSYTAVLRNPVRAHAICEEYRAAAAMDWEHDRADLAAGRKIRSPLRALWSAGGPVDTWYRDAGGPLAVWRAWADNVDGYALQAGHFFPEEAPEQTTELLTSFFSSSPRSG